MEGLRRLETAIVSRGPWAAARWQVFKQRLERGLRPRAQATILYMVAEGLLTEEEAKEAMRLLEERFY